MKLWLDFETYCDLDIKKVGLYKYVKHHSFHVWCTGYAINDEPVLIQVYPHIIAKNIDSYLMDNSILIYAHGAEFEWQVLKRLGYNIPLQRFVDTMALAGTYGYPLQLDKFAKAVGLSHGKDSKGTRLINKLCKPQKRTVRNPSGRWYPDTAPKDFQSLYNYCKQDVKIMRDAVKLLPSDRLTPYEQYVWGHTLMQNERGIKIDKQAVKSIIHALQCFKKESETKLQKITSNQITTGKQVAKIKDFLWNRGVKIPNLQKDTINMYLNAENIIIPNICRCVLELRQQLAYSSVAKFEKMINMIENDGRVRGNIAYHVAHTGRWGGRGVQIHNLLREGHDNPELVLDRFIESYITAKYFYPNINEAASKLVRPVIISNDTTKLCVGDYTSIENVILHWIAGDEKTTQDFRNGLDQYKVYSAQRLNISYDEVTKEQRNQSKPDVLGLGYGAGSKALIGVAAGYGVHLSHVEAQNRVNYYRRHYKKIPQLWRSVYRRAKEAIVFKEFRLLITPTIRLEFKYDNGNLYIHLPSGRFLFYKEVKIDEVWYVKIDNKKVPFTSEISYMGVRQNQWVRIATHPGMLVENIVQALARDCLAYGLLCVEQAGYPVLASVHDEIISEVPNTNEYYVEQMCDIMCTKRKWARDLPLSANGWEGHRYRKE